MPILDEEYDDICQTLKRLGQPITRDNWIALAYGIELPEEWTWEHEE